MKILIVNKFLFPNGGSETYIFKLGEELVRQGHEVEYFGMEHPDRIAGNSARSYTSPMDFHTGRLQKLIYPFKIIYSVEARKKIRPVLRQFKPDVVHLNNFNFQLTPSIIYEIKKNQIPIVYTAHDSQWVCPNHLMLIPGSGERCFRCRGGKFGQCVKHRCIHDSLVKSILGAAEAGLYRFLGTYQKVDRIICPSRFMLDRLKTNPALADKLLLLYNFLGGETINPVEKEDYVLYFGRYSREKGVETLLKVCRRHPEIPFVFAGSGPLEGEIRKCENIMDKGFLTGEELQRTIAKAQFSVFPSECYENCPLSVMESQKYGTPVIAANIGGVPELLQDNVTGELFAPGDAEQLDGKREGLWKDPARRRQYSEHCKEVSFDSVEEYCRKLLAIYRMPEKG